MTELKTIDKNDVSNKTVILRVDFNCPIKGGKVLSTYRIDRSLDTIQYLFNNGVKKIVILTHLGRPEGKFKKSLSLLPIVKVFSSRMADFGLGDFNIKLLKYKKDIGECVAEANKIKKRVTFLPNIRFWKEEVENNENFSKKLAELGEIFVNDAFSVSHRLHASVVGISKYLPSYAGFLLETEVIKIEKAIKHPASPAIAVIGGVKLKTKIPVLKSLAKSYDKILVGGLIAVALQEKSPEVKDLLKHFSPGKIVFPLGFRDKEKRDISEEAAEEFAKIIASAKTILWNGPLGKFEEAPFDKGSKIVGEAIVKSKAYKLAGGGETSAMLKIFRIFDKIDFVSTGGGAMLKLIGEGELPGIKILRK